MGLQSILRPKAGRTKTQLESREAATATATDSQPLSFEYFSGVGDAGNAGSRGERSPTFVDVVSVHIDGVITFNASQPQFSRANFQDTTAGL